MNLIELIPYYGDADVRKQIEKVFSREVLGAVLVGKFVGDYAALLSVRTLGMDLGYIAGILVSISLFVYWHKAAQAAQEAKDKVGLEGQKKLSHYTDDEEQ